ncbi:hypothetical protein BKA70DRAFT_1279031 [Coprinopsis sp. MPI-PUGE-AT-0042]|nr:hypothetical protein BKA70DRAFT_1279031 [Coprinopsis sp. MPI-PUGE-AT-0042]
MDIDPLLRPYTHGNDPLPNNLKPILDAQLETSRTHIAACDTLISETKAKIWECQRRMLKLEEEMEGFREEMGRHKEKKDELDSIRRRLTNTTSPIRRIPPEIIASIIAFSAWDSFGTLQKGWLMNLCAVSTLWRGTGLSTPSLWRSLVVELDHFSNSRSPEEARVTFANALNLWVSRCGDGAGVDLAFHPGPYPMIFSDASLQAGDIVDWIRSCSCNFTCLTFRGIFPSTAKLQSLFSPSIPASLRSMKELILDVPLMFGSSPPTRPSIDLESAMPNLEHLQLFASKIRSVSALFSHSTLTVVGLDGVILRAWCVPNVLRGLPALQSLSLHDCYVPMGGDGQPFVGEARSVFLHRSLRHISLCGMIHGQFFHGIMCPSLERLALDQYSVEGSGVSHVVGHTDPSASHLGEFVQRSELPNLTLHIGVQLPVSFLNVLLSTSSPHIKTLELGSSDSLPVESNGDGSRLFLPLFIKRIQCAVPMEDDEVDPWMDKLAVCLEDASSRTLDVQFGERKTIWGQQL